MTEETIVPGDAQPDSASVAASNEETTETKAAETPARAEGDKAETAEGKTPDPAREDAAATEAAKTLSRRKQTMQERLNDVTQKRREAERRAIRAETELAQLKGTMKAPVASEYQDVDQLTADRVNHTLDQRRVKELESERTDAEQQARDARAQAFSTRVDDFISTGVEDFEQIAFSAPLSDDTAGMIADLEEGPQIAYFLGKNHAEARRISQLPTLREKAVALGRLTERLTAMPTRKTTQAPTPVTAVAGKNAGRSDFDANGASMEDYAAKRKAGWRG